MELELFVSYGRAKSNSNNLLTLKGMNYLCLNHRDQRVFIPRPKGKGDRQDSVRRPASGVRRPASLKNYLILTSHS